MNRHREIAEMMGEPESTLPPIDDDWVNLWYFVSADGSTVDVSDKRGSADLNVIGGLDIFTVDGDYCVLRDTGAGETNVSLAALELDLSTRPSDCTFVLAYGVQTRYGKQMFCHSGDGTVSAIGGSCPDSTDTNVHVYTYNGGFQSLGRGSPGLDKKGLMAWSNLNSGAPTITLVNSGIETFVASLGNIYLAPDMTTMVFGALSAVAGSSYTYWAGLANKTLTQTDLEALYANWDAAPAGWRPGRA